MTNIYPSLSLILDIVSKDNTESTNYHVTSLPVTYYFPKVISGKEDKLLIDEESKYSITFPKIADNISRVIKQYFNNTKSLVITDATSGVGGNSISFCNFFTKVNCVEIDKPRTDMLKNNLDIYGFTNYTIYTSDYNDILNDLVQDIIFIDPPWGGLSYKTHENIQIFLGNIPIEDICNTINNNNYAYITVLKLPYNFNINNFKDKIKITFTLIIVKSILFIILLNDKYFDHNITTT